ncbi:MAG: ATP-binding protein [Prolixibacteraceae bacterium]|jgi:PAS domain S-box-containing protein|nr:ATP-binding protein [Prolixibacteraceae bacterium]
MSKYFLKKEKWSFIPSLIAICVFFILVFFSVRFISKQRGEWEKDIRANLLETLTANKSRLERALYSRIYYTKGVAAYVSLHPDLNNDDFQGLAKLLIKNDSVISTMALSRNCIIGSVFPEEGHEAAIGLDLMAHPERREIVEKTIETHQTFVAGPVELVEGGLAFISYTPIFNKMEKDEPFWGVTDIVIYRDRLFRDAQIFPDYNGFEFALQGEDGKGSNGKVFWGNPDVFDKKPVVTSIDLPTGNWVLAAAPKSGWNAYIDQDNLLYYTLIVSSLVISVLSWVVVRSLVKIRSNERELKAILQSMHNLIIEFDRGGQYLKIAPTDQSLLVMPKEKLIGKTVFEIFEPGLASLFHRSINECLSKNKLVVIEYPLTVNGQDLWFMARISKRSENTVIFNAYDITEKKRSEENIRESESRLRELNAMKDRLFSIIAHDLKTPVGNLMNLSQMLNSEYGQLDEKNKREMLALLQLSSSEAFELLDNLLNWAISQQKAVKIEQKTYPLWELCDPSVHSLTPASTAKNVKIYDETDRKILIECDINLTKTIIRNLLSNAIKFSYEGGAIFLKSGDKTVQGKKYALLKVEDNGVGMNQDTIGKLFTSGRIQPVPGTNNETGTGLGLLLCKEFIEMQGGFLEVSSEAGKGSTFTVAFPVG